MQYSVEIIEKFLGPKAATLSSVQIPDVSAEFDQHQHWMQNHFLNNLLANFKTPARQLALGMIHRATTAFRFYSEARELTLEVAQRGLTSNQPPIGLYFRAIAAWETVFLNTQSFLELAKGLGLQPFDNASPEGRAWAIANRIKHFGETVSGRVSPAIEPMTLPIWIEDRGIVTVQKDGSEIAITFDELAQVLRECGQEADELEAPGGDEYRRARDGVLQLIP